MPRFAVNIVTFNNAERIGACLQSVVRQRGIDCGITIVDNASTDATVERLTAWEASHGIRLIRNDANRLYAAAHNQALKATDAEFVLTLNPDVVLRPDFLARAALAFSLPRVGSVNGRLLLADPSRPAAGLLDAPLSDDAPIDGCGLAMRRSRRPYLRGNRQPAGSYAEPVAIFGADGAAGLYRRAMLDDVAVDGEVFDEDFAIYREDVDLAWRAQLLGWESHFAPNAIAYHVRGFHVGGDRRSIRGDLKRHSVKNGWLLLLKNDDAGSLLRALPWVLPYQAKIVGGLFAVEHSSLGAIPDTLRLLRRIRRKRRATFARRRRSPAELRRWFG